MKKIKLTKNQFTIVDNDISPLLEELSWQAYKLGVDGNFYAARRTGDSKVKERKMVYLHREIMNAKKGQIVDHVNGNTLDNRKENLRITNQRNNIRNQRPKLNRYKGIQKHKNSETWFVNITVNGKRITFSNNFRTPESAALKYNELALLYFGEYARLNIIKEGLK